MNFASIAGKLAVVGGPKVQLVAGRVSRYSPQILTAVGVVGNLAATVLVARATLKLEPLVDNHEMGKVVISEKSAAGEYASPKDRQKDLAYLYLHTGLDLVKLYGPGVSLALASSISIIAGQGLAQKRQVALVAAVKSAESALNAYRQRVIEAIGADKEADIRYGISTEVVEDEDGKKTKVKIFTGEGLSPYVQWFDPSNKNYERSKRELNFLFLKNMQNWANDRLEARGYVYLNEVYSWLGIPEVPAGQVVGWLHRDLPESKDGYIDFGWENPVNSQAKKQFLNGETDGILLDFNVDGEINSKL